MKKIVVYVEGGGDTESQRTELRTGFDGLFRDQKEAARRNQISLRFVPSGGRDETFKTFCNKTHQDQPNQVCLLLVDSEESIPSEIPIEGKSEAIEKTNATARVVHLKNRDKWKFQGIVPLHVHLMVQCMETWLLADPEKLEAYYVQGFRRTSLPQRQNLEEEDKQSIYKKLAAATKDTQKGEYSEANHAKITHASKLLQRIRPELISARCPRFKTFVAWLDEKVGLSATEKQP